MHGAVNGTEGAAGYFGKIYVAWRGMRGQLEGVSESGPVGGLCIGRHANGYDFGGVAKHEGVRVETGGDGEVLKRERVGTNLYGGAKRIDDQVCRFEIEKEGIWGTIMHRKGLLRGRNGT